MQLNNIESDFIDSSNVYEILSSEKPSDEFDFKVYKFDSQYMLLKKRIDELNRELVTSKKKLKTFTKRYENIERSDRLSAMGEMAVNIAHEIRNPLGSIELFATCLHKELKDNNELKNIVEYISKGVKSIDAIISNLLLFINSENAPEFEVVNINDIVKDSIFFSTHLIGCDDGLEVVSDFYDKPVFVTGDHELLKQVCLNIILNAIQAMSKRGRLFIKTGIKYNRFKKEENVYIKFSDSGTGISEENIKKIFNPFFTTKKKGTGVGLSIVHNIIKEHGGSIDVKSIFGKGTDVTLNIPLINTN